MSRIFSLSVPVLFSLAAVDFLLRMDFVMLVLVLSLSFLSFCGRIKGHRGQRSRVVVVVLK